jgi:hypothetical protein
VPEPRDPAAVIATQPEDDALLAGVLRRIMSNPAGGWSLTWTELSIAGAPIPLTLEERQAVGRATGKPTVADPWLRSDPNRPSPPERDLADPTPQQLPHAGL